MFIDTRKITDPAGSDTGENPRQRFPGSARRSMITYREAWDINNLIGRHFAASNGDYKAIQKEIEEKYGEGSLMLAMRIFAARWYHSTEGKVSVPCE
jgi:hypothetical protein